MDSDEGIGARRRQRTLLTLTSRELFAAGAMPQPGQDGWNFEGLPLGGRVKVTGSKNATIVSRLWAELRGRRERRRWGALVTPSWGVSTGAVVHMPMEEFAVIVGELDRLIREKERNDAAGHHI